MRLKLPAITAAVAFIFAGLAFFGGYPHPLLLLLAAVPAAAGIGVLRRRVWAAYGFALYQTVQATVTPLALLANSSAILNGRFIAAVCLGLAMAALFFFTGRTLSKSGAQRGTPIPWILLACCVSIPFFFLKVYVMPSGSMENTVLIGDQLLVRRSLGLLPRYGEIIAFRYPGDPKQVLLKRVVGASGDRLHIAAGTLFRNGQRIDEPYAIHKFNALTTYGQNFPGDPADIPVSIGGRAMMAGRDMLTHHVIAGDVVVPPDTFFVLGDNRDNSLDSRYFGFVRIDAILGRAILIYDSQDVSHHVRWNRIPRLL